jgi:hypothetical protein
MKSFEICQTRQMPMSKSKKQATNEKGFISRENLLKRVHVGV